jgi:hypothetical protein
MLSLKVRLEDSGKGFDTSAWRVVLPRHLDEPHEGFDRFPLEK